VLVTLTVVGLVGLYAGRSRASPERA